MAVTTITIDAEAYQALAAHKKPGQSFSQVIKAHFAARPTAGRFRALVRDIALDKDALDAMARQVRGRGKHRARVIGRDASR
jgi:predicted CopG family antitoxin